MRNPVSIDLTVTIHCPALPKVVFNTYLSVYLIDLLIINFNSNAP